MRGRSLWAAAAAGLLHTASFAPLDAWWLQLMALAWLAHLSWGASPRRAAAQGAVFGIAWLGGGLWWLHISMHQYGHLPWLAAAAAVLLLAAFLASYYAAALALAAWLRGRGGPWHALTWAACWLLAELARATLFTGFPWIASGYAHTDGLLAPWAPWIGVYGISALAAGAAAAFAALGRHHWQPAAVVLALLLVGQVLPQEFTRSSGKLRVSLLQPNVPQDQKFDRDRIVRNLELLAQQIESARGQLVVTPESVVPLPLSYLPRDYVQRLQRAAQGRQVLLGIFLGDEQRGFVNSMLGLAPVAGSKEPYAYGKRHLLPFGEFIPPGFHWFVRALRIPMDDQARGQHQFPLPVAGQRLRPLICYEDLFGEDFVDSVQDSESAATVLINASNLAWFGTFMVQDQHLQFSQMRALEFQRPVIRSTNTGATAVVDHHGRLRARVPPARAVLLETEVEGRSGSTPYARWLSRLGLAPLLLLALLPLAAAVWRRRAA
jgi:apolipoprotein N-acyltransferase